ncbi:MAG: 50S ribosomal protein L34e [Candidatus Odinarchaeia archaeon]
MPIEGKHSRTLKKVHVRTPGNKIKTHFKMKKPSHHICAICGGKLRGKPAKTTLELKKLSKTKKTVYRPYGGYLCHNCLATLIKTSIQRGSL